MTVVQRLIRIGFELHLPHASHRLHRCWRMNVVQQRRRPRKPFVSYQLLGVDPAVRLLERDVPLAGNLAESVIDRHRLKISSQVLLALERLEQRLEVAGAEALRSLSLDDLVKQSRPVFHWLREDLEEIPLDRKSTRLNSS